MLFPALAFLLDGEGRSPEKKREMEQRASPIPVYFAKRRMLENYLLNAAATAAMMNKIDGFREAPITESEIQDWLGKNASTYEGQGGGWRRLEGL